MMKTLLTVFGPFGVLIISWTLAGTFTQQLINASEVSVGGRGLLAFYLMLAIGVPVAAARWLRARGVSTMVYVPTFAFLFFGGFGLMFTNLGFLTFLSGFSRPLPTVEGYMLRLCGVQAVGCILLWMWHDLVNWLRERDE